MIASLRVVVPAALLLSLAACGGGGGDGDDGDPAPAPAPVVTGPAVSATGLWRGTMNFTRTATVLVLPSGDFHVFYTGAIAPTTPAGVVQGTGTGTGASFASSDARDYSVELGGPATPVTLSVSVRERQSLSGSIAYPSGLSQSFIATWNPESGTAPRLADLAGTYEGELGQSSGTAVATWVVGSSGSVTGSSTGCVLTGRATPRTDAHAYDLTLNATGPRCALAGQALGGVLVREPDTGRLYAAARNAARTGGIVFLGSRP